MTDVPGRPPTIALDGPGAAGKSTVGRRVAEALGYLFFDTGVLYRALTQAALATDTPVDDGPALAALALAHPADVQPLPGSDPGYTVWVDGLEVTAALRAPAVDRAVSAVSRQAEVRTVLLAAQRRIALRGEVLMVGRDIATVVLPEAALKLYLDASAAARARRRHAELVRRDPGASFEAVLADLVARDTQDAARALAPLAIAPDAVVVNTDGCDIDAVVAHLLAVIARWPDALTTGGGRLPCPGDGSP
jgi:cytidylate kinase